MEPTVAVNLSVKNVPEELAELLRQRAARNHRSLQRELLSILEAAVGRGTSETASNALPRAALTIDELAAKSAHWFPAGTGQDVLHKTRARPPIWQKPEDFAAKDRGFQEAAKAFNAAAQAGDLSQINARFDTLGKTCKACHDTYRAEKHPH